jgi:hypothetical protein
MKNAPSRGPPSLPIPGLCSRTRTVLILAGAPALGPLGVIQPGSCLTAWIVSLIVSELTSGIMGNNIENCLKTGIIEAQSKRSDELIKVDDGVEFDIGTWVVKDPRDGTILTRGDG